MRRFALILLLAACGGGDVRFAVPPAPVEARVPSRYGSIEVVDVTMPSYAQDEEIFVARADGGITREKGLLWSDIPARGMTLDLARAIGLLTGAQVAPSPWPFDRRAAARVEVRVERLLPTEAGQFQLSGQYFVAAFDGSERGVSRAFDLSVPYDPDGGAPAIAAARAQATVMLAETIARDGL